MTFTELSNWPQGAAGALQWFQRSSGKPRQSLRLLEETLAVPEPERPSLSAGQFVDQIDDTLRELSRGEIMSVLVHLKQSEIRALVRHTAHAKGRYLAALMELPRKQASRKAAIEEIALLRQEFEELETGLTTLRQLILDNDIEVTGVEESARP